jgi:hypothetical protein
MMQRLRHLLARLRRNDGNATIEFVILFPLFIGMFGSAFEAGLMTMRHVMLERATDEVIRNLRLGRGGTPTHDTLKSDICNIAGIIPDCDTTLHIELERIPAGTWNYRTGQVQCIDRDEEIEPAVNFVTGGSNDLMLVTVCAVVRPMVPMTGFALYLPRVNTSDYALVTMSAFVNEPR